MNAKYLELRGRTYYAFEEPDEAASVGISAKDHEWAASRWGFVPNEPKLSFWKRQFGGKVTDGQRKFDWFFGVIMPSVCIFFDPIVFRTSWVGEEAILGGMKTMAFVLSYTAILGLIASLLFGERLKGFNVVLSGLFAVSAGLSILVAVLIAPYSLLGLVFLIGALGFTPFFTSFVYFRNAVRTFGSAEPVMEKATLMHTLLLSALASAVIPYLLNLG